MSLSFDLSDAFGNLRWSTRDVINARQDTSAKTLVTLRLLFDAINEERTMRLKKIFQRSCSQTCEYPNSRVPLNNRENDRPRAFGFLPYEAPQFFIRPRKRITACHTICADVSLYQIAFTLIHQRILDRPCCNVDFV